MLHSMQSHKLEIPNRYIAIINLYVLKWSSTGGMKKHVPAMTFCLCLDYSLLSLPFGFS